MTQKNFRHMISVSSKEIKVQPVTLKDGDDVISFMADLNAAKNTMYEMAKTEEKLKQLSESFNGKSNPLPDSN